MNTNEDAPSVGLIVLLCLGAMAMCPPPAVSTPAMPVGKK